TQDLVRTLDDLHSWMVSVLAQHGPSALLGHRYPASRPTWKIVAHWKMGNSWPRRSWQTQCGFEDAAAAAAAMSSGPPTVLTQTVALANSTPAALKAAMSRLTPSRWT